jgi:hypothetical protein
MKALNQVGYCTEHDRVATRPSPDALSLYG